MLILMFYLFESKLYMDENKLMVKKSIGMFSYKNHQIDLNDIGKINQVFYRGANGENLWYWEFY